MGRSVYSGVSAADDDDDDDDDDGGSARQTAATARSCCGVQRRHRPAWTTFICLLTAFIFAVNGGVLLVVIPTLAQEFGTSVEVAAWSNIAPMFMSAMIATQMGKVADQYGRARTWHVGMTLELLSHAASGAAQSMPQLLIARVIGGLGMGIGAGSAFGLMAAGLLPKQRGVVAAWMMLMGTLGRTSGTSIGGIVMDAMSWRALFIAPVPLLCISWVTAYFVLPFDAARKRKSSKPEEPRPSLDWAGSLVLALFISAVLLGVNRGNEWGWGSPRIISAFAGALMLLPLLLCIELRAAQPIVPFVVLTDRSAATALLIANLCSTLIGGFQMLPVFLQLSRGMSPGDVGLLVMFRPLMGAAVSFVLSRTLMKRPAPPNRFLCRLGSSISVLAVGSLPVIAEMDGNGSMQPFLIAQLLFWALGQFTVTLPANAIVMSRIPTDTLSNVSAFTGMLSQVMMLAGYAGFLAVSNLSGDPSARASYQPVWALMIGSALVVFILSLALPPDNAGDDTCRSGVAKPAAAMETSKAKERDHAATELAAVGVARGDSASAVLDSSMPLEADSHGTADEEERRGLLGEAAGSSGSDDDDGEAK